MKVGDRVKIIANTHYHHRFPKGSYGRIVKSSDGFIPEAFEVEVVGFNHTQTLHADDLEISDWEQMELI
jgi:hypothetical protein